MLAGRGVFRTLSNIYDGTFCGNVRVLNTLLHIYNISIYIYIYIIYIYVYIICIYIYIILKILKIETKRNNETKALKQLENIETKAYCSLPVLDLNRIN